ncbi:MAG: TraR/DksA C4-type zinc finger protein, partial [Pseudomonadales bacterium]|nr:TraR/DksA C4-type zinc finger protein [Pseudomonadales bacterium]
RKIDKTLDRIEKDDYGWCDSCGIEIGIRRLEARPTATLCIDCKTLQEIKEKQWGT